MTDPLAAEQLAVERKRLKFRSWHRGTREMDLLLGRFADSLLDTLERDELRIYAALLDQSDPDIYDWISGQGQCPEAGLRPIVAALMDFHRTSTSQSEQP